MMTYQPQRRSKKIVAILQHSKVHKMNPSCPIHHDLLSIDYLHHLRPRASQCRTARSKYLKNGLSPDAGIMGVTERYFRRSATY